MGAAVAVAVLVTAGGALRAQDPVAHRDEPHAQPMPARFQEQAEKRIAEYEPRLRQLVRTEDPALDTLVEQIYRECVYGKLFEPMPPELPYRWFAPGGAYFTGQWIWDTMFVLIAFAPLDDDAVVRESFDNYRHTIENNPLAPPGSHRYGMVPNFMGARELRKDGEAWPPVGYSQIPILGWGALAVYRQTHDRALIEQALPWLVAFDEWYSAERDVDGDGLIEYGAYEPVAGNTLLQTARFETFDFHLPLDDMTLTRHPRRDAGGEWYGDVEGVEQTSFLLMSERALVEIAQELGRDDLARRYEMTIARRVEAMQRKMWDPKTRFFYSLERDSDRRIMVRTPQGFLPLTAGAATPEQGAELASQLLDPKRWWTDYPVPTIARDETDYDPGGYWRGDMWPPTTYLVALGLSRYGYHDLALELTLRLRTLIEEKGISEHYHGETGEPLGVPGLGMSGVVWSMIVHSLYGVQEDYRTIRVPQGAAGRSLKLGKLAVRYPEDHVVEVSSAFDREVRVVFPGGTGSGEPRVTSGGASLPAETSGDGVRFIAKAGQDYRVERAPKARLGRFEVRETDQGVEVRDSGALVLFYQRAPKDHEGQYARSHYVHPLMSLDGDVLTEDFPADHLHQRGIFWAWHQLWAGDERLGDGWMLEDFTTDVEQVETRLSGDTVRLDTVVSWRSPRFRDGEPFVEERTSITVHPVVEDARAIDFQIALRATAPGIRIGGSEDPKGYGGFSVRARMPDGLEFTGPGGPVTPGELQVAVGPWVDLSGPYGADGAVSGVSILTHPTSPGFPQPWILRQTGSMQNPVFPGRDAVGLPRDRPVVLRYRVVVHRGPATVERVSRWQAEYAVPEGGRDEHSPQ